MLSFSLFGDASSFMEGGVCLALKPSTLSEKLTVQTSLFTSNKVTTSNSSYVLTDALVSQWGKKAQHICSPGIIIESLWVNMHTWRQFRW